MKLFLLVAAAVVSVSAVTTTEDVDAAWASFKLEHGRQYRDIREETVRRAYFIQNYNTITEHNKKYEQGLTTYTMKINKFADSSAEERKRLRGYKKNILRDDPSFEYFQPDPSANIPDSEDWRNKGPVTPVKDQGDCGSCWAFSSTGGLESQYYMKYKTLPSLSEQNLIDCDTADIACDGGDMYSAYQYVYKNNGIDSEDSYPYEAAQGSCRYSAEYNVTTLRGYAAVDQGNEDYVKKAIAIKGPIPVAIDAGHDSFYFYNSGVYYESACSSTDLDHAVLAVGYGSEDGSDYWLIKNSWGAQWGLEGYIKLARNQNNHCGIATEAMYPILY